MGITADLSSSAGARWEHVKGCVAALEGAKRAGKIRHYGVSDAAAELPLPPFPVMPFLPHTAGQLTAHSAACARQVCNFGTTDLALFAEAGGQPVSNQVGSVVCACPCHH